MMIGCDQVSLRDNEHVSQAKRAGRCLCFIQIMEVLRIEFESLSLRRHNQRDDKESMLKQHERGCTALSTRQQVAIGSQVLGDATIA